MNDRNRSDDGRKVSGKVIGLGIAAVVLVLFAVLNTEDAQVNWILGTWETSVIVVIAISGVLGFVIGWLVRGRRGDH